MGSEKNYGEPEGSYLENPVCPALKLIMVSKFFNLHDSKSYQQLLMAPRSTSLYNFFFKSKCFKVVKRSQSYTAEITTQPLAWCHMKDHLSVGGTNMFLFIGVIISDFKIKHETTWLPLPKTQQSGCMK